MIVERSPPATVLQDPTQGPDVHIDGPIGDACIMSRLLISRNRLPCKRRQSHIAEVLCHQAQPFAFELNGSRRTPYDLGSEVAVDGVMQPLRAVLGGQVPGARGFDQISLPLPGNLPVSSPQRLAIAHAINAEICPVPTTALPGAHEVLCDVEGSTALARTNCSTGIVKLTKIGVIDPQDIVVDLLRGPTCWVSESA